MRMRLVMRLGLGAHDNHFFNAMGTHEVLVRLGHYAFSRVSHKTDMCYGILSHWL